MATAHDLTATGKGKQFREGGIKYSSGPGRFGVLHFHFNMEKVIDELGAAITCAGDDTFDFYDIPIGLTIHGCMLDVVTACTALVGGVAGTALINVGDALTSTGVTVNESGYLAETTVKTIGQTGMIITDAYGVARKTYAVAHMLRLTWDGTATSVTAGVFDLYFPCSYIDIIHADTIEPGSWV
jgi:hypothetical protein